MDTDLSGVIQFVNNRPIPKDFIMFFNSSNSEPRIFLNFSNPESWKDDLGIAEKMFSETIIVPLDDSMVADIEIGKDILKQRMKYPGVKENPELLKLAKTWVLPTKVHTGPNLNTLLTSDEKAFSTMLQPFFSKFKMASNRIGLVKIEINSDAERKIIYQLLDEGFRPSLLLVKWSHDVDEHYSTAYCAGHLHNSGYSLIALENDYFLYKFTDDVLYDTMSYKTVSLNNPILSNLSSQIIESLRLNSLNRSTEVSDSSVSVTTESTDTSNSDQTTDGLQTVESA
jgi:hypothetical protein